MSPFRTARSRRFNFCIRLARVRFHCREAEIQERGDVFARAPFGEEIEDFFFANPPSASDVRESQRAVR